MVFLSVYCYVTELQAYYFVIKDFYVIKKGHYLGWTLNNTEWLQEGLYHVKLTHILVIKIKDCP